MKSSKTKYVSSDASYQKTLPDIDGDSIHPKAWEALMRATCEMAKRALIDTGLLVLFIDWRNLGSMHDIVHGSGLTLRGTAIWDKGLGSRPIKNGFRNQAEYMVWATKGKSQSFEPTVYLPGVLKHSTMNNRKVHITQKTEALMDEVVKLCKPGGVIFDPFMGSGTTGISALKSGRKFIGCETVPEYFETAKNRLLETEACH